MKKGFSLVLIIIVLVLSSCYMPKDDVDPTYWGSTYGKMETIDGFKVCLRTDGYYQIIGITDKAVHNGVLIIPQYINGILVMGLGANVNSDTGPDWPLPKYYNNVYNELYNLKHSLELETQSSQKKCYSDARAKSLFTGISQVKKVYINCHHANLDLLELFSSDTFIICNVQSIFITDSLDYYLELFNETQTTVLDCFKTNYCIEKNIYYNSNSYTGPVNTDRFVFDSNTVEIRRGLFNQSFNDLVEHEYNFHIERYLSWLNKNNLEDTEDSFKQFPYKWPASYEGTTYQSDDYYNCLIDYNANYYKFALGASNVEFYYNLTLDGNEYHSFNRPNDSIYWIDYIGEGDLLMEPPVPLVNGQVFLGWYTDPECTQLYDFTKPVHEIQDELVWLKLYAKWQ
ncbi:MAG: InlB B-repeat-containing protein [Bacilli bacterium]|nr:InlB B-repeat-containing protein [Bacilli bacterium]